MSRHKLVKSLDYDEELEDYDGGAGDDFEEELTPEDRGKDVAHLPRATYLSAYFSEQKACARDHWKSATLLVPRSLLRIKR